jgi:phenylalanyl-tRNA synthetase beta chain
MQISLKWVNELVNIETVNLEYLIEKLTLGGFEVEEIFELKINNEKEIALDISATANRSDSLSIQGISSEIAALLNKPCKVSKYSNKDLNWKQEIKSLCSVIPNKHNCSTFVAVTVENLNDLSVPKWLKQKLISSGLTPVNNLLDFQTYMLLETGYPFEFYDLDKIHSKLNSSKFNLTITNPTTKENFSANNNINYQLEKSISLIKANEIPLSIAGIIPNKDFCYLENTKSLLIEGSIFNSTKIRQQSRILGLRTDRSARYEKSLKNINLLESLYKLISLLKVSNPNLICKLHTITEITEQNPKPVILKYKTIKEILGPINQSTKTSLIYISSTTVTNYLNRLNFNYTYDDSEFIWTVDIPYSRSDDLTREIDLIEEIGRLHGFNNFLTRLPKIKTIGNEDYSYKTRKKITSCFLNLGFNELIHYSLVNENTFMNNEIRLINPLISDYSNLRSSLLPNLIKTVQENLKQGNQFIDGFEFGHVFSGDILTNLKEKEYIAGIFGGVNRKLTWSHSSEPIHWFEAKGKIEQFFKQLNISPCWETCSENNLILHPYCTAELYLPDKTYLGIFGQINPILARKLNLSPNLYMFEFDFKSIKNQLQITQLTVYQEYPLYPKIVKDLSFIVHQDISFKKIQEALYLNGTKFLSEINLLDEYRGHSIPEEHTSLCLQLTFQSNEETLQNKKIENIIKDLQLLLTNKFYALIRA